MSRTVIFRTFTCGAGLAVVLAGIWYWLQPNSEQLLKQARLELAKSHFIQAEQLATRAAQCRQPSPWAHVVGAEAAYKDGRPAAALEHYRLVPDDAGQATLSGRFGVGEMECHLGQLQAAEASLRRVLKLDPAHALTHRRLAYLLSISGRRWQATPHLMELLRSGKADVSQLLLLGNGQRMIEDQKLLDTGLQAAPDDPWPVLGTARAAIARNEFPRARQLLEPWRDRLPEASEIQVRWGEVLLATGQFAEFARWNAGLSQTIEEHPELWILRGTYAERQQQLPQAARCFWEVVRRDSEHRIATYRLGQLLTNLGDQERGLSFLQRADLLQQLSIVLDDLFHAPDQVGLMQKASFLTERLGRLWEAHAWARQALAIDPNLNWAAQTLQRLQPRLSPDLPRTDLARQDIGNIDLSDLPLPEWKVSTPGRTQKEATDDGVAVQFRNDAQAAGINFQYFNSSDPETIGARIFETTGGGVGVLDYDGDHWPDLYFTQGAVKPAVSNSKEYRDQFFRNRTTGQFDNVTDHARLGDPDYSQGLTVGDFDNDGFADLYVANFGLNRLYRNNGDGTFSDVTETAGLSGLHWTTSCMIADLNGDTWPDLYDVNYVAGNHVETLLCARDGQTRSCSPRAFDAAPDQVWLNQGDGRFLNQSAECGVLIPNGYGLGIVAADFTGEGQLSLFIANDEVPNFFFVNQARHPGETPRYEDRAFIAGVAVDADGLSQACMGVAAGDADENGMLDLFITNFYNESDTFYRQISPGQFQDDTRAAHLRDATFPMLGFGTQFLDGDLDGHLDLVLTNGHIDDLTRLGQPYRMPPQYFQNQGGGRFTEVSARQLGAFFQGKYLGRGLARVDWNRDGREDFAVSHLDTPAALVTNTTQVRHHFLALQLRGRFASRDAIGTVVRVTAGGRQLMAQLTAGDGYHASNQRQIVLGLASATRITELTIQWPGGARQTWNDVAADQEFLAIEGAGSLWTLPR